LLRKFIKFYLKITGFNILLYINILKYIKKNP